MYAYIKGALTQKSPTNVVIEANGIGYLINISLNTYSEIQAQKECLLYTYLHVKEDALTLYGFSNEQEKQVFVHLISVSGIGPNTARMILSSLTSEDVQQAIAMENVDLIQKIKGIGAKTAQRLVLELKDKVYKVDESAVNSGGSYNTSRQEALSALVMLGFAKGVAEKAIDKAISAAEDNFENVEELIKAALKHT
jgi:Holliday junction DNA helicase RuvA